MRPSPHSFPTANPLSLALALYCKGNPADILPTIIALSGYETVSWRLNGHGNCMGQYIPSVMPETHCSFISIHTI